jgi:anaerobic magnesium-protoporphyrin IX monomethyl ester cyclase
MKDAAAQLTQVSDEMLHNVFEASRLERLRIQQVAEGVRELPMVESR